MKNFFTLTAFVLLALTACAQSIPNSKQRQDISTLIDKYSEAREKKDTILLKSILTADIDQLVSTGEWRDGVQSSVKGMLKSSATSPGTRTLTIDKIRMVSSSTAIVDCK